MCVHQKHKTTPCHTWENSSQCADLGFANLLCTLMQNPMASDSIYLFSTCSADINPSQNLHLWRFFMSFSCSSTWAATVHRYTGNKKVWGSISTVLFGMDAKADANANPITSSSKSWKDKVCSTSETAILSYWPNFI